MNAAIEQLFELYDAYQRGGQHVDAAARELTRAYDAAAPALSRLAGNQWTQDTASSREDVLQEAHLRFGKALREGKLTFENSRRLVGYFRTIVRRCLLDQLHERHREREALDAFAHELTELATETVGAHPSIDRSFLRVALDRHDRLRTLSHDGALVSARLDGIELGEYASAKGISHVQARKDWERFVGRLKCVLLIDPEIQACLPEDWAAACKTVRSRVDELPEAQRAVITWVLSGRTLRELVTHRGASVTEWTASIATALDGLEHLQSQCEGLAGVVLRDVVRFLRQTYKRS